MPKTHLSRERSRSLAAEFPTGDPFGGPAFGEFTDVGSIAVGAGMTVLNSVLGDDYGAEDANNMAAASSRQQVAITGDMWDFYKTHYRPLEEQATKEAADVGGAVDQEQAAARASASVSAGYDAGNRGAQANLMALGVRPDSPAFQSAVVQGELAKGAQTAVAGNDARENSKWAGRQWRDSLVSSARGVPGTVLSAYGANTAQQTQRAQFGTNLQRADAQNIGYMLQPAAKAASAWFQKQSWGSKTPTSAGVPMGVNPSELSGQIAMTGGSTFQMAEGGEVQSFGVRRPDGEVEMSGPGLLQGPGTGTSDEIPARTDSGQQIELSNGEYVIPAEVVRAKGTEFFDKVVRSVTEGGKR